MDTFKVVLIVLVGNAVVWTLVLACLKRKARLLTEAIHTESATTGETIVIGPERGYYNYMKGIASVKTSGVIALTNKRLIFRGPANMMNTDIPFDQIADLSQNLWFQGNYRNGNEFIILKLKNDHEVAFQVNDTRRWAEAIQSSMSGSQTEP